MCLPTCPKYPQSITRPRLVDYPNTILYVDLCLALPPVDHFSKSLRTHLMMPMLTRTHRDDAEVDPNSSEGVDTSSSEDVDIMSSEGVDTILIQTAAKMLSVLIPNVSCRHIARLP